MGNEKTSEQGIESLANIIENQTAIYDQLKTIKRNYDKTSVSRRTRGYVQTRIEMLETNWTAFQKNDLVMRSLKGFADTKYYTENIYDIVEEFYCSYMGDLTDIIYEIKGSRNNPAVQSDSSTSSVQQQAQVQPNLFRLPQISIPSFSGDYASWSAFSDMFESLIHNNNSLSNVQKLHYLKANLRGDASNLLRNTTITNDNYPIAWKALQTRFANKRALVDAQLKLLFNQKSHNLETASNIRSIIDISQECLNALRGLNIDVDAWDPILLFLLVQKLHKNTHQAWELGQQDIENLPKFEDFIKFLEQRFRMLESLSDTSTSPPLTDKSSKRFVKSHTVVSTTNNKSCPICTSLHYIRACDKFLKMSIPERRESLKRLRVCFNCLVPGHFVSECKNRMRCQKCNKNHHTLLHNSDSSSKSSTISSLNPSSNSYIPNASHSNSGLQSSTSDIETATIAQSTSYHASYRTPKVLLATAIIHVMSSNGELYPLRALIDQGSEVTLITEHAIQLLNLKGNTTNCQVSGIGNTPAGTIRKVVSLDIRSKHRPNFSLRIDALVLKSITGLIPRTQIPIDKWAHIEHLTLADPNFGTPNRIDVLLGADAYNQIIMPGIVFGESNEPIAQSTNFGWIISGNISTSSELSSFHNHISMHHTCIDIDNRLKMFWEIEHSLPANPPLTKDENLCEQYYAATYSKNSEGRFVVKIPLKSSMTLGESRTSATQRLLQIERSLSTKPDRKAAYIDFMREYISLGHMKLADSSSDKDKHYIPHHAIFKSNSSTTKTRVVFDASNKTTNGVSLNDMMLVGPKIQDDLSTIILRWRKFPIAFTSDIEKMYRQVLVHDDDQHLQHILWRESNLEPILEYALKTITYGTSSAPYLAVRTLRQLANETESTNFEVSRIIRNDFYVDDLMSGAYTADHAFVLRRQLSDTLLSVGFKLRKWVSNYEPLLHEIPAIDREIQHPLNKNLNETVTALGITWNPSTDEFSFRLNLPSQGPLPTKRNILSEISKLFDPLGWLAPIIIQCKILMQQIWTKGIGWDQPVTNDICDSWETIRKDLFNVNKISIARWISHHHQSDKIDLHGFSDASSQAYAAVVYARTKLPDGKYKTTLLTAKTRVSPLKQISIPRLELCGAALVAELLKKTQQILNIADENVHAWTDSSIVIHWLRAEPRKWKTFIANRVSAIQQLLPMSCWRHVPTHDNPADCASRGLYASNLTDFDLWWTGPKWLIHNSDAWPKNISDHSVAEVDFEQRICTNLTTTSLKTDAKMLWSISWLESFSSLLRLIRITAFCRRFITKYKSNYLTPKELEDSLMVWLKISQQNQFSDDIFRLQNKQQVSPKSKLNTLNVFLDSNNVVRVGGRLKHSNVPFDERHPIVVSNKGHLTELIIRYYHEQTKHGGPQLVLSMIRKKYWIVNARNTVRLHIQRCVKCHRYNAESASQIMGNLPKPRVNISRAFTHTGVDYAGPINIRMSKGRGNSSYKGYIALFICLSTKAIHIEIVSDLTSNAFIAAYRRFVARRGLPAHMYSDNGTNFVGANKIMQKDHQTLMKVNNDVVDNASKNATEWHFIPPSSPHFGGLWEAGVKSLKYHLHRTIGETKLTYEELSTLVTQIESCLNSRPLTPMTSDINDETALTPGHFLTGDALLAAPDRTIIDSNLSLLSRWHLVQKLYTTIANRWRNEYLSRLQQRPKWLNQSRNVQVGDLVLVKDSNLSPSQWPLARVIQTHPGDDNLVRVVTLRSANSVFKRCINKISLLPL